MPRKSVRMLGACLLAVVAGTTACAARARETLHPIPDLASDSTRSTVRGTPAAERRVSDDDAVAVVAAVVRQFFRPTGKQARWIDPQLLSNTRSAAADSAAPVDDDRAEAVIVDVGLGRVCLLDDDKTCRGLPGSLLRFSPVYATAPDAAIVFARITPVDAGDAPAPGPGFEMEFRLARRNGNWHLTAKRTVASPR